MLKELHCTSCGGNLELKDGLFVCESCGRKYKDETIDAQKKTIQNIFGEMLAAQKEEQIANIRRNLWQALHQKYTDSKKIVEYCRTLKNILPDDFRADFFETANSASNRDLAEYIDNIDCKKHLDDMPDVLDFLLKSLTPDILLAVNNLIERAYKNVDIALYDKFSSAFALEAKKVDDCVYDVTVPRDVFVAYSSVDMKKVSELVAVLEQEGLSCFVAMRNLQHGRGAVSNYQKRLEEAMDNCKSVVFVSSVASRTKSDARKVELPYIRKSDLEHAPAQYRNDYTKLPAKYKKPRVEYLLENYAGMAAESFVKEFFTGNEYRYSPKEVAEAIFSILSTPIEEEEVKSQTAYKDRMEVVGVKCLKCGTEYVIDDEFNGTVTCHSCGEKRPLYDIIKQKMQDEYEKAEKKNEALAKKISELSKKPAASDNTEELRKLYDKLEAVQSGAPSAVGTNNAALLRRGNGYLESGDFDKAEMYFNFAIDNDPNCGEAWFGLFLSEQKLKTEGTLVPDITEWKFKTIKNNKNYKQAASCAAGSFKTRLENFEQRCEQKINADKAKEEAERKRKEEAARKAEQERLRLEAEKARKAEEARKAREEQKRLEAEKAREAEEMRKAEQERKELARLAKEAAIAADVAKAKSLLDKSQDEGDPIKKELEEQAVDILIKSAKSGNAEAKHLLGCYYIDEDLVCGDRPSRTYSIPASKLDTKKIYDWLSDALKAGIYDADFRMLILELRCSSSVGSKGSSAYRALEYIANNDNSGAPAYVEKSMYEDKKFPSDYRIRTKPFDKKQRLAYRTEAQIVLANYNHFVQSSYTPTVSDQIAYKFYVAAANGSLVGNYGAMTLAKKDRSLGGNVGEFERKYTSISNATGLVVSEKYFKVITLKRKEKLDYAQQQKELKEKAAADAVNEINQKILRAVDGRDKKALYDSVKEALLFDFVKFCNKYQRGSGNDVIIDAISLVCANEKEFNSLNNIREIAVAYEKLLGTNIVENGVLKRFELDTKTAYTHVIWRNPVWGPQIKSIEKGAFGNSFYNSMNNIIKIVLPEGVEEICERSFYSCADLEELHLPLSIKKIGDEAYIFTNIKRVYYAGTIDDWCKIEAGDPLFGYHSESSGYQLFTRTPSGYVAPTEITIKGDVGQYQFTSVNNIKKVTLDGSCTRIGRAAFSNCLGLEEIDLGNVAIIDGYALCGKTSLRKVFIPDSVTSIGPCALSMRGSGKTEINLPKRFKSMKKALKDKNIKLIWRK